MGKIFDELVTWAAQKQGFEAGVEGKTPRYLFFAKDVKENHEKGYKEGQDAALIRMGSRITNKITE